VRVAAFRIMTRVELEYTYVFLREESKSAIRIAFGGRELDLYMFSKKHVRRPICGPSRVAHKEIHIPFFAWPMCTDPTCVIALRGTVLRIDTLEHRP